MLTIDAPGASRIDFFEEAQGKPFTTNQRFSSSAVLRRFQEEFAYYRADAPYLPLEKCADRCRQLSLLLTVAALARGDRP